ncbi:hypothetical protein PR048_004109 [Dryococelus australis]|uniref:Uncharacterized protein n=1 Tax=Dryococelus australis TaxID=614101 RepID=A0ABQ9I4J7_9NEOP|nr:hypothetical protein PR048_004109 [Dryococelus australis]
MECGDTANLKWNILQAMQRLCMAWNRVEATSIAKCSQKTGFQIVVENQEGETSEVNMHTMRMNGIRLQTTWAVMQHLRILLM